MGAADFGFFENPGSAGGGGFIWLFWESGGLVRAAFCRAGEDFFGFIQSAGGDSFWLNLDFPVYHP